MSKLPTTIDKPSSAKAQYRVRNWREYDQALVSRGSLTLWFDDAHLRDNWTPPQSGKPGAPVQYSDMAIQSLLVMKEVFRLPYRALEGFAKSLMRLMELSLAIPDHTHMSRRAAILAVQIPRLPTGGATHVVVDSTGLKVYGEGEWKVRQHGVGKRRTWRKVHLGVDEKSKGVIAVEVTTADWGDAEVFDGLLDQIPGEIEQVSADGAYDTKGCHRKLQERGARATIPPRAGAKRWGSRGDKHPRDEILDEIEKVGEAQWKRDSGYHRRSLSENAMYRLKQLFGDRLSSRGFSRQTAEVHCRVVAMNMMTSLGMPISEKIRTGASGEWAMA